MNYWENSPDFWGNKTKDNAIYKKQAEEVRADLKVMVAINEIDQVVDVGGYKGRIGEEPIHDAFYLNLDIVNGFDITKSWKSQGMIQGPNYLCFTSLTLICQPPEKVRFILDEMWKYSEWIYLFEEEIRIGYDHGQQINNEYGGKWAYDWQRFFENNKVAFIKQSEVNPAWVRIGVRKR